MEPILTLEQLLEKIIEKETQKLQKIAIERNQVLAGLRTQNEVNFPYAIQIIISKPNGNETLLEYQRLKAFSKTTSRYSFHPENANIPVQAHYHIYSRNSKQEIYAVNMDGTAHHRANGGYQVPRKEADELRALGVQIPLSNIIESKQIILNENTTLDWITMFIILDNE
jgi:hypothetical protein